MEHALISVVTFQPGTAGQALRRANTELTLRLRNRSGFISHAIVRTSHSTAVAISRWQTRDHALDAKRLVARWGEETLGPMVVSCEHHLGPVVFAAPAPGAGAERTEVTSVSP
ncbi:MAG: hypothetical protein HY329_25795 [Chloroflexi bacterium]|nr:hypothetical protein [Chloroflexota bacterium]